MALLYLGIGRSVFVAEHVGVDMHRHKYLEITLALDHPFAVRTAESDWIVTRSVAIRPDVPHQYRDFQGLQASLQLIPEQRYCVEWAGGSLRGIGLQVLDSFDLSPYVTFFRNSHADNPSCFDVFQTCERMMNVLTGLQGYKSVVDERILKVLDLIQANIARSISSKKLAGAICLSEDRFLHLFKEQLGIPLRAYVVNQRIMRASEAILRGKTLTQAALDAGFSDSSHYSRTFVSIAGTQPSVLKQFRGKAEVYSCSSSRCVRPTALDPQGESCSICPLHRSPGEVSLHG
jgi:AraC-like DNA-binding protein